MKKTIIILIAVICVLTITVVAQVILGANESAFRKDLQEEITRLSEENRKLKFNSGAQEIANSDKISAADAALNKLARQEQLIIDADQTVEKTRIILLALIEYMDLLQQVLTANNIPYPALILETEF